MPETTYKPRGRPPSNEPLRQKVTLTLKPEAAEKLRRLSANWGVAMSEIIGQAIERIEE